MCVTINRLSRSSRTIGLALELSHGALAQKIQFVAKLSISRKKILFAHGQLFCRCCCRNSVLVVATIISCLSIVMLYSHVKFKLWILAKSLSAFVQSAVDAKCRQNVSPQCQCTRSIAFLHLNMLLSSQVNLVLNVERENN